MRKPWNLVDLPVYSLSTIGPNGQCNMNICTYVTLVSMKPKRYAVAVYHETTTLENIEHSTQFVLQLLSQPQYPLVKYFGQKSAQNFNKMAFLDRNQLRKLKNHFIYKSKMWNGFRVLEEAVFVGLLAPIHSLNCGDHTLFLCEIKKTSVLQPLPPLTLSFLRDKKLIRG